MERYLKNDILESLQQKVIRVPPFHANSARAILNPPKFYFNDPCRSDFDGFTEKDLFCC